MIVEAKTIYEMAKALTNGAEKALENKNYRGYPAYVHEYNNLLVLSITVFGIEVKNYFSKINLGKQINPSSALGGMHQTYLELAYTRLTSLTSYIKSKLGNADSKVQSIIDMIEVNLRPSIYDEPKKEKDVQDVLETLLRVRNYNYQREKMTISYSSKNFIPDFTIDELDLALEIKLCKTITKEKAIIDEINADIPAYKTKYNILIFIVYDLGFIRDVNLFKSGIEDNSDVYVILIKK